MENLVISASHVEIGTESDRTFMVEIGMPKSEWERVLAQYSTKEIVDIVGSLELLEHIDTDDIVSYLNDIGYKVEKED